RHHHRSLSDGCRAVVARIGNLHLEAEEAPNLSTEDLRLLELVDVRIGKEAVGGADDSIHRPLERITQFCGCLHAHLPSLGSAISVPPMLLEWLSSAGRMTPINHSIK